MGEVEEDVGGGEEGEGDETDAVIVYFWRVYLLVKFGILIVCMDVCLLFFLDLALIYFGEPSSLFLTILTGQEHERTKRNQLQQAPSVLAVVLLLLTRRFLKHLS